MGLNSPSSSFVDIQNVVAVLTRILCNEGNRRLVSRLPRPTRGVRGERLESAEVSETSRRL